MSKETLQKTPQVTTGFIDQTELLRRVPVSRKTLYDWREGGKIPFVRVGGRRLLFHWPSVEQALLRHQSNTPEAS